MASVASRFAALVTGTALLLLVSAGNDRRRSSGVGCFGRLTDANVELSLIDNWPLLFGAGAEGARGLLPAVASSMITVAGVVHFHRNERKCSVFEPLFIDSSEIIFPIVEWGAE